jgi:dipeptidase
MTSPGLLEFATENALYIPDRDGDFNFRTAFARIIPADVQYNYLRIYTVLQLFTPAFETDFAKGEFPTFMTPAEPLSVADVAGALRNHYQGTDKDPYTLETPDSPWRPVAVFRQSNSHVTELKGGNAPGADIVTHFSMGMNLLGAYVPFYTGISSVPHAYGVGDKNASADSAFWTFRRVQTLAMRDFKTYAPIVQEEYATYEQQIAERLLQFETEYNALYKEDPIKALKMMQAFSDSTAEEAMRTAERLAETLLTLETQSINATYLFEGE